ncbi:hypothetical protein AWN90_25410 [Nocardia terpenica]|uniref:Uncharacterized protein n=1 Tax=Nocardia terpenica TaxID=455432 RepID=A0A164NIX4_9NOCA|nr:hypothetical protein AWN90_25410 [Nocardia terpenica]
MRSHDPIDLARHLSLFDFRTDRHVVPLTARDAIEMYRTPGASGNSTADDPRVRCSDPQIGTPSTRDLEQMR